MRDSLALGALLIAVGALIATYQIDAQYQRDRKLQLELNTLLLDYAHGRAIPRATEIVTKK